MADDRCHDHSRPSTCSWRKRGRQDQALGRSRGGFSTKIHAVCDSHGNPLRFILTGGNCSDYDCCLELLKGWRPTAVLADKGYDADYVVAAVRNIGAEVVIPARSHRKTPREHDKHLYKERNLIERMFNYLKHFRRVSTRYDKTALSYLSFLHLAGAYLWLK